jgi:tetratricopeptide (TPR) repeat protein
MQRPFISSDYVQSALDALLYTSAPMPPNPLCSLLLIDQFLINPDFPKTEHARESALQHTLVALITEGLTAQRQAFDLGIVTIPDSRAEALAQIEQDAAANSIELAGWSALYYRYVCVNLDLSTDMLSSSFAVDPRTLRRYQRHGVRRLKERLVEIEWRVICQQRKRRLSVELPIPVPVRLFGRERFFLEVEQALVGPQPHHVFVTGPRGIGKTTCVQEFIRAQIDAGTFDYVVWFHCPETVTLIREQLTERLIPDGAKLGLRDYLSLYHVAIVLDDIERLTDTAGALEMLLDDLAAAFVCLLNTTYVPLSRAHTHLRLGDLDEVSTAAVIRAQLSADDVSEMDLLPELVRDIRARVGGNPLAIKLLARLVDEGDAKTDYSVLERVYASTYRALDEGLQRQWYAFALMPPGEVLLDDLRALWLLQMTNVRELAQRHLVERVSLERHSYTLTTSALRFLQAEYAVSTDARRLVNELIMALELDSNAHLPLVRKAVEHLLETSWLNIEPPIRRRWLRHLWRSGAPQGHYARWRSILERELQRTRASDYEMQTLYAVCLRRFGRWSEAQFVLHGAIREAGQAGDFVGQAKSMVELSILCRYQGDYKTSLSLVKRAEQVAQRYGDTELYQTVMHEYAQSAIDQHDGFTAIRYLDGLPESTRTFALVSEGYMLTGSFRESRWYAERALAQTFDDPTTQARFNTILGRGYERENDAESACHYFTLALMQLERTDDPFAQARAQSNLGVVMMRLNLLDEAETLFAQAEQTERSLGDVAGAETARHNLRLLHIRQSSIL